MPALLFGSISTLADTSELQRDAFNEAFKDHGLDWSWSREEYQELIASSGGEQRIAAQAQERGQQVDAAAVHRTKSERFQRSLQSADLAPREGVIDTIREARDSGYRVALVTTTTPENVAALLEALGPDVGPDAFDLVVDTTQVDEPKPAPAAYAFALERLGESAADCVAVEDNLGGVESAQAAGVAVAAFPNQNTAGHDFGHADGRVDHASFTALRALVPGA